MVVAIRWPSAGVSGGGRDLALRADDLTSVRYLTRTTSPKDTTQASSTSLTHPEARLMCGFTFLFIYLTLLAYVPPLASLTPGHGRSWRGPGGSQDTAQGRQLIASIKSSSRLVRSLFFFPSRATIWRQGISRPALDTPKTNRRRTAVRPRRPPRPPAPAA